ncbi:MAG: hypothetical protein KDA60_12615 [Planctomycetales bacterium]|nr:hypothetical protein [Planctomycetales bacterium]
MPPDWSCESGEAMASTFEFLCHHCEQRFRVSEERIGARLKCPKCGQVTTVPRPEVGAVQVASKKASRAPDPAIVHTEFLVYDDQQTERPSVSTSSSAADQFDIDPRKIAVPRYVIYSQGALLGLVALLSFLFGAFFGGCVGDHAATPQANRPVQLSGSVMYLDRRGVALADDGSVVLAFPADARPEHQLSLRGLRPDTKPLDADDPNRTALHVMGGSIARVENGMYQMDIEPGQYFVLVVSANQRRPRNDEPTDQELAQIGRYVVPAFDLLDRNAYRWEQLNLDGPRAFNTEF